MTRICPSSGPGPDRPEPASGRLPDWFPEHAATYLSHVASGETLRAIARRKGCHPSTVLRQVRKVEAWREDPLIDEALSRFGQLYAPTPAPAATKEETAMREAATPIAETSPRTAPEEKIEQEARRILRRLCEKGAFLAVAPNMEKAVVLREVVPGKQNRIAVVDSDIAHAFALKEWIACDRAGKIACYAITPSGRGALKRLLLEDRERREPRGGFAEAQSPFQGQHRFFAERSVMAEDGSGERRLRFNLAESPLLVLGRKRDKDGVAYLTPELVAAGERLREDFELAGMGPRVTQNWERFLTAGASRGTFGQREGEGAPDARTRVAKAMEALGPGLSDIVFRICCFLEGLETAEKRLGWSARSGKVVLKIALERLAAHYGILPRDQRAAG